MMNRNTLLILGNGFDLDLGWRTTYLDFYRSKRTVLDYYIGGDKYVVEASMNCWCDLEKYLRQSAINIRTEKDIEALWCFWLACHTNLRDYLFEETHKPVNEKSCAYSILQRVNNCKIVSFNYTDPFESVVKREMDIFHVHYSLKSFNVSVPKIKFGFDESAIEENPIIESNEKLRVMVKSIPDNYDEEDRKTHLLKLLRDSNTIVFYGLSLSITDSDYFNTFFELLISGTLPQKNLYFITKNPASLASLKKNMNEWGVFYDNLVLSPNEIVNIYTDNGPENGDFKIILDIMK